MKNHLRLLFVLAAALSLSHAVWAYDFTRIASTGQRLYFTINGNGTVKVTYPGQSVTGQRWDGYIQPTGSLTIPASFYENNVSYTVTEIDNYAFEYCTGLTHVVVPNTVTRIGRQCFYCCTGLTSFSLPTSVTEIPMYAFFQCGLTGSLTLGNTITTIGYCAFANCESLTGVTISDNVTNIDENAFTNCTGLTQVNFNATNCTTMGSYAHPVFYGCNQLASVSINTGVRSIPDYAFKNCSHITDLFIAGGVQSIGASAFDGCGLTGVTLELPNSVTTIGNSAFNWCGGMTGTLTLPTGLTTLGKRAFAHCAQLTDVVFPANLATIGEEAFLDCSGLAPTSLTIPANVTSIGKSAFGNCTGLTSLTYNAVNCTTIGTATNPAFEGCSNLQYLGIGEEVTSIPVYAFNGSNLSVVLFNAVNCTTMGSSSHPLFSNFNNLTWVIIGTAVQRIPRFAFDGCTHLSTVSFPISGALSVIDGNAFFRCSALTGTLSLPATLTEIGANAFKGCSGLTGTLTIPELVTDLGGEAFGNCTGLTAVNFKARNCTVTTNTASAPFFGCTNLTTVTWGQQVTKIPNYLFAGCSSLTGTLNLPASVTEIGYCAFEDCSGLTGTLTIPASVTSIYGSAFEGCSGFTGTLTIPEAVTTIKYYAFRDCSGLTTVNFNARNCRTVSANVFSGDNITTLNIGNQVNFIPDNLFENCTSLQNLTIPYNVVSVGTRAFRNCTGLTGQLDLSYVSSVENKAFEGCANLSEVIIPNTMTSIGHQAFKDCSSLTHVQVNSFNPPLLTFNPVNPGLETVSTPFVGTPANMTVTIPCGTLDRYQAAWGTGYNFVSSSSGSYFEIESVCDSYTWPVNGMTYTETRDEQSPVTAVLTDEAAGCQSTVSLILFVSYSQTSHEYVEVCAPSYYWDVTDKSYSQSGDKLHTGTTYDGCPIRDTLTLTIVDHWGDNYVVTSCGTYTWNNPLDDIYPDNYSQSGVYYREQTDFGDGCPVRDTLTLTITDRIHSYTEVTNYGPYTWDKTGQTYNKSGLKFNKTTTPEGCLVRDTLKLTVIDRYHSYTEVENCGPYTWDKTGQTYNKSGLKFFKGTADDGCPVRDTLNLTVTDRIHSYTEVTSCGPYTWDKTGQTYNKSGLKFNKGTAPNGCLIRDTLKLTVTDRYHSYSEVTHCGPYTWELTGQTYNKSGLKFNKGTAADGCPIRDTLKLTVVTKWSSHDTVVSCDGAYTWDKTGQTYKKTGMKFFKGIAADGCPIRDTLYVIISQKEHSYAEVTSYGPYTWDLTGKTYNKSGLKFYKGTNDYGCPVRDTLNLTVLPAKTAPESYEYQIAENAEGTETPNPIQNSKFGIQNSIKLFPNPTTGVVHLTLGENSDPKGILNSQFSTLNSKVEVLDLVGRRVATFENTTTLDLSALPNGTYTLRITTPQGTTLKKIVKE